VILTVHGPELQGLSAGAAPVRGYKCLVITPNHAPGLKGRRLTDFGAGVAALYESTFEIPAGAPNDVVARVQSGAFLGRASVQGIASGRAFRS
jgi:hypothetical protein